MWYLHFANAAADIKITAFACTPLIESLKILNFSIAKHIFKVDVKNAFGSYSFKSLVFLLNQSIHSFPKSKLFTNYIHCSLFFFPHWTTTGLLLVIKYWLMVKSHYLTNNLGNSPICLHTQHQTPNLQQNIRNIHQTPKNNRTYYFKNMIHLSFRNFVYKNVHIQMELVLFNLTTPLMVIKVRENWFL